MARNFKKTIALIGGSGLAQGLESILQDIEKFENIKNKFGIVLSYYIGYHNDLRVVILPRHGDCKNTPSRSPAELVQQKGYEANIWQLHELGVEAVLAASAVGALDHHIPLASDGSFMIPKSYVRGIAATQHSFGADALTVHTPMTESFDNHLSEKLAEAITANNYEARKDTLYIYNGGDTFETPHEIKLLDRLTEGIAFDRVVGMTTVPELILCKQVNIPFATIASNVNYAEGLSQKTLVSHEQTLSVMETAAKYILNVMKTFIEDYQ